MSTLRDDDLFLVNRERESYTISYEQLKEQLGGGAGIIQTGLTISSPDNYVGSIITASGGEGYGPSGPLVPTYSWTLDGVEIAGATGKTLEPLVAGTYQCTATVVDGALNSDAVSNELIIETIPGVIDKPSILLPVGDGGTLNPGTTTYLISDAITEVEGGGVDTCETKLIQSVSGTAPNITLTFPDSTDFECFADGDVVQSEAYTENWSPYLTIPADHSWGTSVYPDSTNLDAFDGDLTNFAAVVSSYADTSWTFTFPQTLTGSNDFTIYSRGAGKNSTAVTCTLYDADGNQVYYKAAPDSWAGGGSDLQFNFTGITNVKSCVYVNSGVAGDGACVYGFELNGKLLIDNSLATDQVKIVGEPDSDNNTIVVDGGDWKGDDNGTITGDPNGQTTLVKETPYDTKLTVAGPKDLADMTGTTFMSDGAGAFGPYTQTPYKLVTTDIESVTETTNVFDGDASNWTKTDITTVTHYPANSAGPFTTTDNSYLWCYDVLGRAIDNPDTAKVEIDLVVPIRVGASVEVAWQGKGSQFYARNIIELLDASGNVVASSLFSNPSESTTVANKVSAGVTTGLAVKLRARIDSSITPRPADEYIGGFAGIWFDGVKYTEGTYEFTTLTFPGDVSTNPDLRYFKQGDVVQTTPDEVKVVSTGYPDSNTMVVDGGDWSDGSDKTTDGIPWDQSQNWSAGADDSGLSNGTTWSQAFDGYIKPSGWNGALVNTRPAAYSHTLPIALTGQLRVYCSTATGKSPTGQGIRLYNSQGDLLHDQEILTLASSADKWQPMLNVNDCTRIELYTGAKGTSGGDNDQTSIALQAVELNGKVLVNPGGGATFVEYQTDGGEGEIISVNTDDNTILLKDLPGTDRDNRWIIGQTDSAGNAGNSGETGDAAGAKDFFVAGPSDTNDLLTADIEFKCTGFSTTPSNADTWKNTRWELETGGNKTYYDVADETTWKPGSAILSPNTTYKVRVQHEGNLLDPSDQSGTVTITTGASRNMYELIANRLTSLEAAEVADTAGDTALLTLITELANRVQTLEDGGN